MSYLVNKINNIFLEDCMDRLNKESSYDYAFFSPPDYDEINMNPKSDSEEYFSFVSNVLKKLNPTKHVVTVVISDRKFNSTIIPKHKMVIDMMFDSGYKLVSQKIWRKSPSINLYRLNYAFVLSFAKQKCKQHYKKDFKIDVWDHKHQNYEGYSYNMPIEIAQKCIENFTNVSEVVYDPFMGVGTTAIACINSDRFYMGSEIDPKTYELCMNRIDKYEGNQKWY
jgi:DNA modification methylase